MEKEKYILTFSWDSQEGDKKLSLCESNQLEWFKPLDLKNNTYNIKLESFSMKDDI